MNDRQRVTLTRDWGLQPCWQIFGTNLLGHSQKEAPQATGYLWEMGFEKKPSSESTRESVSVFCLQLPSIPWTPFLKKKKKNPKGFTVYKSMRLQTGIRNRNLGSKKMENAPWINSNSALTTPPGHRISTKFVEQRWLKTWVLFRDI